MALRQMTYGDTQALKVLAAERLGLEPACVDIAMDTLNGKPVHPTFSALMGGVASDMHNVIAEDENLVARANAVMTEIMGQYFPAH